MEKISLEAILIPATNARAQGPYITFGPSFGGGGGGRCWAAFLCDRSLRTTQNDRRAALESTSRERLMHHIALEQLCNHSHAEKLTLEVTPTSPYGTQVHIPSVPRTRRIRGRLHQYARTNHMVRLMIEPSPADVQSFRF